MILTQGEKQQIKSILQDPKWQTIEHLVVLFCDKISYDSVVRETEWDTLKTAIGNEAKIQGIKSFIQELYVQAEQSK